MSIRGNAPAAALDAPGTPRLLVDSRRIARGARLGTALALLAVAVIWTPAAQAYGQGEGFPVAVDDVATVARNSGPTTIDVLANDTNAFTIMMVGQPFHGTTAIVPGEPAQVSYAPDADYCNDTGEAHTDTFTYMINGEDTATVAVTVTCGEETPPVPPAPPPSSPLPLGLPAPLQPSGAVSATCLGRAATIVAAAGQTTITGTAGNDVIVGADAGETIDGRGGNDVICAGKGDDDVRGGSGNDEIAGEPGRDRLFGDGGRDLLLGGAGDDRLRGGSGDDRSGGGDGEDTVYGDAGNDRLDEMALGGNGRDRLYGGAGNDRVRTAGWSPDRIDCGAGRDRVTMDVTDRARRCETVARPSS